MSKKELVKGIDGSGKKLQSRIWFFSLVEEENDIPKILQSLSSCPAVNVFTIRHDKDKIKQDDGSTVPKRPHWHFALRFETPYLISTVANMFFLQPCDYHLVQKAKNWRASCRYMLHLDQRDKHLYDIKELQTIRGEKDDYFNIAIGKAQVVTTDADLFPDFGNFDKVDYETQYLDIFNNIDDTKRRNTLLKELKTSWENYLQKRRFEMKTKSVTVIWVEGLPDSGKSTFAINLANNNNKSYVVSSSSNDIMQDYTAQDYLILDDLRDDTFSFTDLLKLLDNYVISTIKSRYNNKMFLGDTIIVTSCKPLCEWYKDTTEDKTQLYRRINMFVKCRKVDNRLIADIYIPPKNMPVVNTEGKPNGKPVPTPIMVLTPDLVKGVEDICASLGIDLSAAVEPLAQQAIQGDLFSSLGYTVDDLQEVAEEDNPFTQPKKKP